MAAITINIIDKKRKQRHDKVLQKFRGLLVEHIGYMPKHETVPKDILSATSHINDEYKVYEYLNRTALILGEETFNGITHKTAYEYWLVAFIKCQLTAEGYGNRKLMAGYLIKQLGKGRLDKYHISAYLDVLESIYQMGRLGLELKDACECVFNEYSTRIPVYGKNFTKNIIN